MRVFQKTVGKRMPGVSIFKIDYTVWGGGTESGAEESGCGSLLSLSLMAELPQNTDHLCKDASEHIDANI